MLNSSFKSSAAGEVREKVQAILRVCLRSTVVLKQCLGFLRCDSELFGGGYFSGSTFCLMLLSHEPLDVSFFLRHNPSL